MSNNQMRTIYEEKIFQLAKNQTNEMFYNSSSEHAIIVHQALVRYAEKYVYIFSSSMCSEVSNNPMYVEYIKNFLAGSQDRRIKIILTEYSESFPDRPIAKVLAQYSRQVEIKRYNGLMMYKEKPAHFTVSDDRAFRLETDIEKQMAFGNFNSPNQANDLKNVFNEVFSSEAAITVQLPNVCAC